MNPVLFWTKVDYHIGNTRFFIVWSRDSLLCGETTGHCLFVDRTTRWVGYFIVSETCSRCRPYIENLAWNHFLNNPEISIEAEPSGVEEVGMHQGVDRAQFGKSGPFKDIYSLFSRISLFLPGIEGRWHKLLRPIAYIDRWGSECTKVDEF